MNTTTTSARRPHERMGGDKAFRAYPSARYTADAGEQQLPQLKQQLLPQRQQPSRDSSYELRDPRISSGRPQHARVSVRSSISRPATLQMPHPPLGSPVASRRASRASQSHIVGRNSSLPAGRHSLLPMLNSHATDNTQATGAATTQRPSSSFPEEQAGTHDLPPDTCPMPVRGLRNIGNTCYLNAVIQCLAHCREFHSAILTSLDEEGAAAHAQPSDQGTRRGSLVAPPARVLVGELRDLLSELWAGAGLGFSKTGGSPSQQEGAGKLRSRSRSHSRWRPSRYSTAITPTRVKMQLGKLNPEFAGCQQQDAHEALQYLLNALHEDVNTPETRPPQLSPTDAHRSHRRAKNGPITGTGSSSNTSSGRGSSHRPREGGSEDEGDQNAAGAAGPYENDDKGGGAGGRLPARRAAVRTASEGGAATVAGALTDDSESDDNDNMQQTQRRSRFRVQRWFGSRLSQHKRHASESDANTLQGKQGLRASQRRTDGAGAETTTAQRATSKVRRKGQHVLFSSTASARAAALAPLKAMHRLLPPRRGGSQSTSPATSTSASRPPSPGAPVHTRTTDTVFFERGEEAVHARRSSKASGDDASSCGTDTDTDTDEDEDGARVLLLSFADRRQYAARLREQMEAEKVLHSKFNLCQQLTALYDRSPIHDAFRGWLRVDRRCLVCDHRETTFEHFLNLSLPIIGQSKARSGAGAGGVTLPRIGARNSTVMSSSPSCSLHACFDSFTSPEVLDDDNMISCERCQCPQRSERRMSLHQLPRLLVIHLKRFEFVHYRSRKIDTPVDIPTELDLSGYVPQGNAKTRARYELCAATIHAGSVHGGHYTALCRHPVTGRWFNCNDSSVCTITTPSASRLHHAYLLFFQAIDDDL